jgi:hypothetical protein
MPENRSDKSRFESRFGGGFVSVAQYLAENMCDRTARKERTALPAKFWQLPAWKQRFLMQVTLANRLLAKYDSTAIIRALKTPRGKTAYSFGAPFMGPIYQSEQEKLVRERESLAKLPAPEVAPVITNPKTRPVFVDKQSPLSKLRGLE